MGKLLNAPGSNSNAVSTNVRHFDDVATGRYRAPTIGDPERLSTEEMAHVATHEHGKWKGIAIAGIPAGVLLGCIIGAMAAAQFGTTTTTKAAFDARVWACVAAGKCRAIDGSDNAAMEDQQR